MTLAEQRAAFVEQWGPPPSDISAFSLQATVDVHNQMVADFEEDLDALLAAQREADAHLAEHMTDGVHVVLCENIARAIRGTP